MNSNMNLARVRMRARHVLPGGAGFSASPGVAARSRGFGLISLIIYGVAAAVVVGAVWWVVSAWQAGRAAVREMEAIKAEAFSDGCRKDTAIECVREIKERLSGCLGLVEKQNEAVKKLEEASKEAKERARIASLAAAEAKVATKAERERLSALMASGKAVTACPAGEGVAEARKGLKP